MRCPHCQSPTQVLETRSAENDTAIRRRRACSTCSHRFTTFERCEPEPLYVQKRDGSRQRFDRDKLRDALTRAAHKRPVHRRHVTAIVASAESMIAANGGEASSESIASHCLKHLGRLDRGAYLQFAGTLPDPNAEFAAPGVPNALTGSVRGASNHG